MAATLLLLFVLQLDPHMTPGVVRPLTRAQVCTIKWGRDARHVTEGMKRRVAASYGIDRATIVGCSRGPCCEFDHLIPRELGGADDVRNLWPQPWAEAKRKDRLENWLHREVCTGRMALATAQKSIATDWRKAYLMAGLK